MTTIRDNRRDENEEEDIPDRFHSRVGVKAVGALDSAVLYVMVGTNSEWE